jgi:hypothetical protein
VTSATTVSTPRQRCTGGERAAIVRHPAVSVGAVTLPRVRAGVRQHRPVRPRRTEPRTHTRPAPRFRPNRAAPLPYAGQARFSLDVGGRGWGVPQTTLDWDGDGWEQHCLQLLRLRYREPGQFERVPSSDQGVRPSCQRKDSAIGARPQAAAIGEAAHSPLPCALLVTTNRGILAVLMRPASGAAWRWRVQLSGTPRSVGIALRLEEKRSQRSC